MWKSLAHFFASIAQKVLVVNKDVQKEAPVIEGLTGLVPVYGPLALPIEKVAFAVLGEIAAVLTSGASGEAVLHAAGVDPKIIATVKEVVAHPVSLADVAKAAPTQP